MAQSRRDRGGQRVKSGASEDHGLACADHGLERADLEDFVIYGLITLGLVILPTQVFAGTPLFCTPCLEVRSNSEITLQHLTLNIRMTNVGQT